ncbi:cytochrome P450 6j1-like [Macrosteles quadrilineatus]|uniref:cytochrome P450 6j1-like n=1 Tax=Macrosteles quadrilineatus TaxID=74068 RepID=UPI0023E11531|nr:cytochrome P450 6j1-like [Macrosteles quadrilineatus]
MAVDYVLEIFLAAIITLLPVLFYFYLTSEYSYWKKRNVPYIKPSFPFGNIKDQVINKADIGTCFKVLYDQMPNEKYFGIFELGKPTLVLRDQSIIKAVMVTDFYNFADRGHIHQDVKKDFLAALHLFNLKDKEWKRMRTKLTPTFTSGRMKKMYHLMFMCSLELDKYLENVAKSNETVEFKDLLSRFTSDSISSCLFGLQTNAVMEKDSEVRKISKLMFPIELWNQIKLMLSINQPYVYDLLGLEINHKKVKEFCMQVAKETYDYRVNNNIYREDFIDLLIKIKQNKNLYDDEEDDKEKAESRHSDGSNDGLTFEEMAAQVFVMFAAGFETSSTTTTMALYEMARQPDILAKAVQEVDQVLKRHGGQITYQSLKDMAYLEQVIYETLRLYPSLPILTRKCTKPYKMPDRDLMVESGVRVIIPSFAINRDPEIYPDPLRFDPERFNPSNTKEHKVVNLHFGDGPMACIGMRFGKMQVKCALTTILSKYEVSVVPETPEKITLDPRSFLPAPLESILLRVSKRQDVYFM